MPHIVVKPWKDADEYLVWSTVTNTPVTTVMTRDEMFSHLSSVYGGLTYTVNGQLERADDSGLSSRYDRKPMWDTVHRIQVEIGDKYVSGQIKFRDIGRLADAMKHEQWSTINEIIQQGQSNIL